jgi:ribosomal protein L3 glutamine methyltransferase
MRLPRNSHAAPPVPPELATIRDFVRWAASRFAAAGLAYGHGTDNAVDEAAFMVTATLRLPIDRLEPFFDSNLTAAERQAVADIVEQRIATRKPAPYLTGSAYIQGVRFRSDERALVPRSFIGELIATEALGPDGAGVVADPEAIGSVLDLGTGSGCLAVLAAMAFPNAAVDAVDISAPALALAALNVADHDLAGRISLIEGDLFGPLKGRRYDLIIANPPYVSAAAMAALPPEYRHEPAGALAAGDDGLDIVRRILRDARNHLTKDGGGLLCEVGTGGPTLEAEFSDIGFLWLDTEASSAEVFWLAADQLPKTSATATPRRRG